jgi:low affinity Fe/Cu permease
VTGPLFHYSDTWQLVIITGTTISPYLFVFPIQNTQNRDTTALQVTVAELIIAFRGAHHQLAAAEGIDDANLDAPHLPTASAPSKHSNRWKFAASAKRPADARVRFAEYFT